MLLSKVEIISNRLIQIPISDIFIQQIFENFTSDITKYMYPKSPVNIQETAEFVHNSIIGIENGSNLQLVVLKKENNEFIGCSGIHNIGNIDPELGIWVKKSEHGNGYGLEAITILIKWAQENIDFKYLKYPVEKKNIASRRIPENNNGVIMNSFININLSVIELDEVEYWIYKEERSLTTGST